ncbi:MAG: SGNH/GDSL hydrolase family protein [Clostridia bacterium]|nr:SGNH/GDSL hydrolase family protein [Clostridia bacterium]
MTNFLRNFTGKLISILLVFMMLGNSVVLAESSYTASDWAIEELDKAKEMNLIPELLAEADLTKPVTRKEFAAISVLLYEKLSGKKAEAPETNPFTDTDDAFVLKAYNLGITAGTLENTFSPDSLLEREQAASMLTRVYKKISFKDWSLYKDADFKLEYAQPEKFADDEQISDWAKNSVYFTVANGIIKGIGDNKFAPKNTTEAEILSGYANASREQAIIIAARMTELEINLPAGTVDPYDKAHDTPDKADGKNENKYTVAFIGGSLTEGGSWITTTKKMLQEKMPDKEVISINAGKGGTRSNYGAARIMEDVGKYSPDMVFIEFAVNDCGQDGETYRAYTESMVRQCMKLPKKPVIIFLYAPHPVEKDSDTYKKCEETIMYKEHIAEHYGIKSINVYDYMQRDYEKIKAEKGYSTFTDYLSEYYVKSGDGFDVHGGYEKYAEAIIEAFENDYEGCMALPKNAKIYCAAQSNIVSGVYRHLYVNGSQLHFSGPWKKYTVENQLATSDSAARIGAKQYKYPFFPTGVMQVCNEQAAFGFMTKAEAFCVNYITSTSGNNVKVYIDNVESGTVSTNSASQSINTISSWISLPNDGKEHKVILIADKPTNDKYVFMFGSIIERSNR